MEVGLAAMLRLLSSLTPNIFPVKQTRSLLAEACLGKKNQIVLGKGNHDRVVVFLGGAVVVKGKATLVGAMDLLLAAALRV